LTRVVHDVPSTYTGAGDMKPIFRQIGERDLKERGAYMPDIRARELRGRKVDPVTLHLDALWYTTGSGDELFLQVITEERLIAGFLRLSLPTAPPVLPEREGAAMICEVHVYGQALDIGAGVPGTAQHSGLGTQLIERAVAIAAERGYQRLAVISSVGTRVYYRKRGFVDGELYQFRMLNE
ncbi:MAG: GNAT family N-acetyltransferase, partial [Anaerolineae bacterium]|nr:GNAT family N-acetyltransferase [Anaerolineae bacterium]